jgi:hypothetical protein
VNQERIDDAVLLASELVSNAIAAHEVIEPRPAHGSLDPDVNLVRMRLLDLGISMVIEVWDASPETPKFIEPSLDAVHGRGLQLVDALSIRWGHYASVPGKVVWCQLLALSADEPEVDGDEPEAYQRVLEELQAHPWNERA